jgi:phosphate starvation-inducible PhoH-like protein
LSDSSVHVFDLTLTPVDNRRLASLCGRFDENLRQIERRLAIEVTNRGNTFQLIGSQPAIHSAAQALKFLYEETNHNIELTPSKVHLALQQYARTDTTLETEGQATVNTVHTRAGEVRPRSPNQTRYIQNILTHDINFGIGPAGTGKTFLAVASAVAAFEQEKVRRILLVRPAVEAGERLGFLPGDIAQKIDPYLRPLYDALYEMLGFERVAKLLERQIIEIASLAYMRGRTLNDAFIILDEAQNTTVEQMKMFLTRLGFSSTAVITGDVTQVDLPKGKQSGLKQVIGMLQSIPDISFTFFNSGDVVRHPVVQKIIEAYALYDTRNNNPEENIGEY